MIIIIILATLILAFEFSSLAVLGRILSDKFLDKYFTKERLEKYKRDGCSGGLIYSLSGSFISTNVPSLLSKWYIDGIGRIPRWSKWHKRINELYEEILLGKI